MSTPPPSTLIETTMLPIEDIKPYPGNPRRIPDEAVDAVAESITRYGYQQPIVVDSEHVVVVGHTRLRALQQLGWTHVPVHVTALPPAKVKEYRLVDNRTGELTSWNFDELVAELREFEAELVTRFFPDLNLELDLVTGGQDVTDAEIDAATDAVHRIHEADATALETTTVVCPNCSHEFEVRTSSLPGLVPGVSTA